MHEIVGTNSGRAFTIPDDGYAGGISGVHQWIDVTPTDCLHLVGEEKRNAVERATTHTVAELKSASPGKDAQIQDMRTTLDAGDTELVPTQAA